jgi:putative addiction module component (TIGR02574 family)
MNTTLQSIEAAALKLTPQERADLADRLWASLHSADDVERAWHAEIERRLKDVDEGGATCKPWSEVMASLDAAATR